MEPDVDLLQVRLGSVFAPAGCGKTELLASTLKRLPTGGKPVLVLTHTNAGANVLQQRFLKNSIPPEAFRIATIDGWAMKMVSMFPGGSGYALDVSSRKHDYDRIQSAAVALLSTGNLDPLLTTTYSRLFVDEYQDCSVAQHAVVLGLSRSLPTVVLGDPLQAIFGFKGIQLVSWSNAVTVSFPEVCRLQTPWRWINAKTPQLGKWLLDVRQPLENGHPISIGSVDGVEWVQLRDKDDVDGRLRAASYKHPEGAGSVLIICDSQDKTGQQNIAKRTYGACTVEAVDLRELTDFASGFKLGEPGCLDRLLDFAFSLMTKVDRGGLRTRMTALRGTRSSKPPSPVEFCAMAYEDSPSFDSGRRLLKALASVEGARVFRPSIYYGCLDAMSSVISSGKPFPQTAIEARERQRQRIRSLPQRAVGSTLLLKGLEADVAVVLHPEKMKARDLYVALTRGSRRVLVCSPTPQLTPLPS